jgi:hypothetical protein
MMFGYRDSIARPFDPFIWHNLAFHPFKLSQPANQRVVRLSLSEQSGLPE